MRELKFRAWALRRDNTMGWIYSEDESNLSQYFDWTEDFEQEHYTSRKDKKGKKIYEGDLVRWDDATWQIVFDGAQGWMLQAIHSDNYDPNDMPNLYMQSVIDNPIFTRVEIIGNTHEHGYLLEKANS
jgi:hypothetical protein